LRHYPLRYRLEPISEVFSSVKVVERQYLSGTQAYELMRTRATELHVTVAEVSGMIIEAHEAMERLGLKL
jgi:hypothetical protein